VPGLRPSSRAASLGEAAAERGAGIDDVRADPHVAVGAQLLEADAPEIIVAPAPLMAEIGPFAGDGADGARGRAGGAERQEVGKVEEIAGILVASRQIFFQPEQLRCFHLRRDDAADIAQHVVGGLIDAPRLRGGAVIHPDDDVALGIAGGADRDRARIAVERDQRAGGIEADTADRLRGAGRPRPSPRAPTGRRRSRCRSRIARPRRRPHARPRWGGVPSPVAYPPNRKCRHARSPCRRPLR
jgi:hypothetical protein